MSGGKQRDESVRRREGGSDVRQHTELRRPRKRCGFRPTTLFVHVVQVAKWGARVVPVWSQKVGA